MEDIVADKTDNYPVQKSDAEWRQSLDPLQYNVLRQHGTERAFTSPLNDEKRQGAFICAGCGESLFDSNTKFESGTGWPSFWEPMPGKVGTTTDRKFPEDRHPRGWNFWWACRK